MPLRLYVVTVLALALWVFPALAQENTPAPDPSAVTIPAAPDSPAASPADTQPPRAAEAAPQQTEDQAAAEAAQEAERLANMARAREAIKNRKYDEPTIQNLSKLYWAVGIFDPDRDYSAVDNYIMINECDIFHQYYTDDFEWKEIHEATRQYLAENKRNFSKRFEFVLPIELGRYNFETESFKVLTEKATSGSRRIEMLNNNFSTPICGMGGTIEGYPRNIILNLSRPLHVPFVSVKPDVAQDFLARTRIQAQEKRRDLPDTMRRSDAERIVFLRIRVRIVKFIDYERSTKGETLASFFATLEGYDIFEDQDKKKLLYSTAR